MLVHFEDSVPKLRFQFHQWWLLEEFCVVHTMISPKTVQPGHLPSFFTKKPLFLFGFTFSTVCFCFRFLSLSGLVHSVKIDKMPRKTPPPLKCGIFLSEQLPRKSRNPGGSSPWLLHSSGKKEDNCWTSPYQWDQLSCKFAVSSVWPPAETFSAGKKDLSASGDLLIASGVNFSPSGRVWGH